MIEATNTTKVMKSLISCELLASLDGRNGFRKIDSPRMSDHTGNPAGERICP